MADYTLHNDEEKKEYYMEVDNLRPRIEYILAQGTIYLTHTEVPKGLEGKGIGSQIVLAVFEDIDERGLTLVPLCPFVATYIKRHPEWRRLVLKGINIV